MFGSLTYLALMSLTLGQGGQKLTVTNAQVRYGELGPIRIDTKFTPGDVFFISYDLQGLSVDPDGKILYAMEMEVVDSAGKPIYKQAPSENSDFLPLGGNVLPARAFVGIGIDQAPGNYTCKVTVTDRASKSVASIEKAFEVVKKSFSVVQVYVAMDREGKIPASQVGFTGQLVFVHFSLVGFERDKESKEPKMAIEMVILDEAGKPTLAKPSEQTITKVAENALGVPLVLNLPLNRAGNFKIQLKAVDKISKKESMMILPYKVLDSTLVK